MTTLTDIAEIKKLKVTDLRKELQNRGLNSTGNKSELVERLQTAVQAVGGEAVDDEVNEDDVLGDDEALSPEEQKTADFLLSEDLILPQVSKTKPSIVRKTMEKENAAGDKPNGTQKQTFAISAPVNNTDKSSLDNVKILTAQERMELRAKRFNVPSTEDAKKEARAARFGIAAKGGTTTSLKAGSAGLGNAAKLIERANRFGSSAPGNKTEEEKLRLLKRKERFGAVVIKGKQSEDTEAKKQKRAERFGLK